MGTYSKQIDPNCAIHYRDLLKLENCVFSIPRYTFFKAKNRDWEITFYKSGKVVVQGKDIEYPVRKFFENNYGENNSSKQNQSELASYPHIGIDESGKGDFFGPLVVAGCYLTEENALEFRKIGITDSKKINDKKIIEFAKIIKEKAIFDIVIIGNKKYNELYSKFNNLNKLLAWAHCTVLENLLNKTDAKISISDKFGDEKFILNALKEKGRKIQLIQQTKAESDTAVAAASVLARCEFINRISKMSENYGIGFPKGAGENVLTCGKEFIQKYAIQDLMCVSKTHFKTYEILRNVNVGL